MPLPEHPVHVLVGVLVAHDVLGEATDHGPEDYEVVEADRTEPDLPALRTEDDVPGSHHSPASSVLPVVVVDHSLRQPGTITDLAGPLWLGPRPGPDVPRRSRLPTSARNVGHAILRRNSLRNVILRNDHLG